LITSYTEDEPKPVVERKILDVNILKLMENELQKDGKCLTLCMSLCVFGSSLSFKVEMKMV
jgi:hypothetical protein